MRAATLLFFAVCLIPLLAACQSQPSPGQTSTRSAQQATSPAPAQEEAAPDSLPTASSTAVPVLTSATPLPTSAPTLVPSMPLAGTLPPCGHILPIISNYEGQPLQSLDPDPQDLARLQALIPADAQPALDRLLSAPDTVGLAAYRVGQENQGVFLNADLPMPLASVVKVIHLVAYAEAVAAGELDPTNTIFLDELEAFYLPNIDLGAHPRALAELEENGRVFGSPPAVLLDEVPGMMIASSSNAATDYLHLLLGQETIEETAAALDLTSQTAPCPFLGQFLAMGSHVLPANNSYQAWGNYRADPASYGRDAMLLTEAFSRDDQFRQEAVDWRRRTRQPSGQTQRLFFQDFNAQGSAAEYAALMARIAQNGLGNGDSSYIARRFLEWPMRYADNQALFSNLGYKNGTLPGIMTIVYYAYPKGETAPIVVALFFRDLEGRTYREWRDSFAHDELARWLLTDPQAIPALRAALPTPSP